MKLVLAPRTPARACAVGAASALLAFPGTLPATDAPWRVEANARVRWESRDRNFTFDRNVTHVGDDSWWLTRLRVAVDGPAFPATRLFVQCQDSREFGSERPRVPFIAGSEGNDPVDLRQAYLQGTRGEAAWRVGRQTLAFGDERLIGASEWSNVARSFDAIRVTYPRIGDGLDVFLASVVRSQPGGRTGWRANTSSGRDLFGGVHARQSPAPALQLESYLLWRNHARDTVYDAGSAGSARPFDIPQRIVTAGVRVLGGAVGPPAGFGYDLEFAGQTGKARGRQVSGTTLAYPGRDWLAHRAWALHLGAGPTLDLGGATLRLYGEINRATGDRDPGDRRTQSFLNLFPTNHKFYGGLDAFAWKNLREVAVSALFTRKQVKVRLEHHWFALDRVQDTWFRANAVTAVRPLTAAARQAGRKAGRESDVIVTYAAASTIALEAGFSHFEAGDYLARTGGASDARFVYVQTTRQW